MMHRFAMNASGGDFDPSSGLDIVGCIVYESPAGNIHHTRFCLVSERVASEVKVGDSMFTRSKGNIAD